MLIKAVWNDGTFIEGDRTFMMRTQESKGTHKLLVTSATDKSLKGKEIEIPIVSPKIWITISKKKEEEIIDIPKIIKQEYDEKLLSSFVRTDEDT